MAIKHTLVQPGDIIEADASWRIERVDRDDFTKVTICQNYKRIEDKSSPKEAWSSGGWKEIRYPREDFVDMNGPEVTDSGGLIIDGVSVETSEIVRKEGISVRGKTFVVTSMTGDPDSSYPLKVTAVETEQDGKIKSQGLTVKFNQQVIGQWSKPSADTDCVHDVKVIGNKIWDKPSAR